MDDPCWDLPQLRKTSVIREFYSAAWVQKKPCAVNVNVFVGFFFFLYYCEVFGSNVTAAVGGLIIFDQTLNAPKVSLRVFVHVFCLQM